MNISILCSILNFDAIVCALYVHECANVIATEIYFSFKNENRVEKSHFSFSIFELNCHVRFILDFIHFSFVEAINMHDYQLYDDVMKS